VMRTLLSRVRPSPYVHWAPCFIEKTTLPSFESSTWPLWLFSSTQSLSRRSETAAEAGGALRCRNATTTTAMNTITKAAIAKRAFFCHVIDLKLPVPSSRLPVRVPSSQSDWTCRKPETGNWHLSFRVADALYIGDAQLKIRLTLKFVLFEGKGEVDAGAILIQELD